MNLIFLAAIAAATSGMEYSCTKPQQDSVEVLPAVVDYAGILSDDERLDLNAVLISFAKETTHQFAVEIVSTLDGENIEEYALERVEARKLGVRGKDTGLLLLIVVDERKMRIEVGYGLEAVLPDSYWGSVIRETITPDFSKQEYYSGIRKGLEELMDRAVSDGM